MKNITDSDLEKIIGRSICGFRIEKNENGEFFFQAELTEVKTGSVIIAKLENIFEVGSPIVGGPRNKF